jgi:hypothetical protein
MEQENNYQEKNVVGENDSHGSDSSFSEDSTTSSEDSTILISNRKPIKSNFWSFFSKVMEGKGEIIRKEKDTSSNYKGQGVEAQLCNSDNRIAVEVIPGKFTYIDFQLNESKSDSYLFDEISTSSQEVHLNTEGEEKVHSI